MIPHLLSQAADKAASRYDALADTFEALYRAALLSHDFGYVGQSQKLFAEAYGAAGLYFERDKQAMHNHVQEIAEAAHQRALAKIASVDASSLSDAASEHLSEILTYLSNEIAAQVHRDIAHMRLSLQRAILNVSLVERSRRIPTRQAQMTYVMKGEDALQLHFVDRRGRRTPTRTFIRSLYRQALLSVWNEVTLHTIADHGLEHAAVKKLEAGLEIHTDRIAITEYLAVRDSLFHPNANSFLDAETLDV